MEEYKATEMEYYIVVMMEREVLGVRWELAQRPEFSWAPMGTLSGLHPVLLVAIVLRTLLPPFMHHGTLEPERRRRASRHRVSCVPLPICLPADVSSREPRHRCAS